MWRHTLARRAASSLSRFQTQTPSSSSSPSHLLPLPLIFSHSPHSPPKYNFKSPRPFSSQDLNLNENENPDVSSSETYELVEDVVVDDVVVKDVFVEDVVVEDVVVVDEVVENDVEEVESLLSLLQSSGGGLEKEFESRLNEIRLVLTEDFVVSVLKTPHVPPKNFIAFYGWCLRKKEFSVTDYSLGVLVRVISSEVNKEILYQLWDLFKGFGKDEGLSTEILNRLICLFSLIRQGGGAYEVFEKFEEFGCVRDSDTYYYTIEGVCQRRMFDIAGSVSKEMVSMRMLPDDEKIGKIIDYLSKGKKARDAYSLFVLAKEKNKCPPRDSVDALIRSLSSEPVKDRTATQDDTEKLYRENIYLALEILDTFSDEDRKFAAFQPFSSVCKALCKIGDVDKAKGFLYSMIKSGPPPGSAVFNAIITGLSKAGELDEAMKLLKVIEERGLIPDVYAYADIMRGYVEGGAMVEALQVLEEAKQKHVKLTPLPYDILIRGYCKLEQFDEAVKLLAEMEEYGVKATADAYNKLIESLCINVLDWQMAERLQGEMKEKGLRLNGRTRGLISAVKELEAEGMETQEIGK